MAALQVAGSRKSACELLGRSSVSGFPSDDAGIEQWECRLSRAHACGSPTTDQPTRVRLVGHPHIGGSAAIGGSAESWWVGAAGDGGAPPAASGADGFDEGSIKSERIDKWKLIEQHYHSIASRATT